MSETDRTNGRVKWFNNKSGFGFITLCDGDHAGQDIFVLQQRHRQPGDRNWVHSARFITRTLRKVSRRAPEAKRRHDKLQSAVQHAG